MDPYVCKTLILFLCQRRDPMITLIHRVLYRFNTLTLYSYFTWAPPPTLILVLKICFDHLTLLDGHIFQFHFISLTFFSPWYEIIIFDLWKAWTTEFDVLFTHFFCTDFSIGNPVPPPPPPAISLNHHPWIIGWERERDK